MNFAGHRDRRLSENYCQATFIGETDRNLDQDLQNTNERLRMV